MIEFFVCCVCAAVYIFIGMMSLFVLTATGRFKLKRGSIKSNEDEAILNVIAWPLVWFLVAPTCFVMWLTEHLPAVMPIIKKRVADWCKEDGNESDK